MNPSDGKMDLDLTKMVGKTVFVEVANETYQGKEKPRVANLIAGGQEAPKASGAAPSGSPSLKAGDTVSFINDGETFSGKLLGISGDTCRVEVDGDEWELELSELFAA
jgi:hypothetical protein